MTGNMHRSLRYFALFERTTSWRASVASETVLGVDNAKSGICYMYICMWDGTYAP